MKQKLFACLFALFVSFTLATAQEGSKIDTILLQNVLESKEVLKLNENKAKTIEDAGLNIPPLMMENENRYSMPPAVFSLYILKMVEMDPSLNFSFRLILTDNEKAQIKIPKTTLSSMIVPLNTDPLHMYGRGNLVYGVNYLMNLIFKKQQVQNVKKPMTEIERNQIIQEINSLRQSLDISVVH